MPQGYAASTTFTMTLASLAANAARESVAIDNTTNKYDDYMIQMIIPVAAGTTADEQMLYVYFAGSADGTYFTEPATGTDSAIVVSTNTALRGPYPIPCVSGGTNYDVCIGSVAQFFGGNMPKKFSVILDNQCNNTLGATEATFYKSYTGVFYTT